MLIPVVLKPIHIITHILARVDISLLLAALRKINSELQIKLVLAAQLQPNIKRPVVNPVTMMKADRAKKIVKPDVPDIA